jgi:membrane associated rhomboid family serine protease
MNLFNEVKYTFSNNDHAIKRIVIINVAVFLTFAIIHVFAFLFRLDATAVNHFKTHLMLPASFATFISQPWSILTCMFLHDGFFHILFNMLWLFWIGNLLHEYLGNQKVYEAYFAGGVFGGVVFMVCYQLFPVLYPYITTTYALGASAGVLSVVVAAATLLPNYPFQLLLFGNVKLKYLAIATVLLDFISIPQGNASGHIAHIGGALFGYLYIKYIYKYGSLLPEKLWSSFRSKSKVKIYHQQTHSKIWKAKPSQDEVDRILDKISKSGYDSLTKIEKDILFKASKV